MWKNLLRLKKDVYSFVRKEGIHMKINIHIVAPYESMTEVIKECIPLFPALEIDYSIGDLADGAEQAIQAEKNGAEIIISRGGTAQFIKKAVSIPVIDIQLSGYDMIRSLTLANDLESKTAIVGFANITSGAQSIIDLLDYPLKVFTISESDEVAPLILKLKSSGYQQIIGDVITMKTSYTYGLKGLLIQSGKESIIASLENAKLLYHHLQIKNDLSKVFEEFILQDINNFMVMDEQGEVIYEHWTDFESNPLSKEYLYILNTDLGLNKNKITGNFTIKDNVINFKGHHFKVSQKAYKFFMLERVSDPVLNQKGLAIHSDVTGELIAAASDRTRTIIDHVKILYKKNEVIHLQGKKGTGKEFLVHYFHKELSDGGMLLSINLKAFDSRRLKDLPLKNIGTIKLTHIEFLEDEQKLSSFIRACHQHQVRVFILTESTLHANFLEGVRVNKIIMPVLSERTEDIRSLVQYFIAYYHQEYGTKAVKISDDALKLLERSSYPNHIDDLKSLIKQVVLNEKDYVIQKETIENLLYSNNLSSNIVFQKGTLKEIEKEIIKWVLLEEDSNQTKAAERLGISRATLWRKLKE